MTKVITALYAAEATVQNVVDDLINIGLPAEKILADEEKRSVKVIVGTSIEPEIGAVLKRHKPAEITTHSLKEKKVAETLTATYAATDTLQNVVDDLINIGLPAEGIFAENKSKTVKAMVPKVIAAEIREVMKRHDPIRVE